MPTELDAFYEFARIRMGNGQSPSELEDLLNAFREQRGGRERQAEPLRSLAQESTTKEDVAWVNRLQRWADGFPALTNVVDDSRESIYRDDPAEENARMD